MFVFSSSPSSDVDCVVVLCEQNVTLPQLMCNLTEVNNSILEEGNVLFNDAFNTFYLRLYGVRHMVKDHSDSKRENPLPPHGLLFFDYQQGLFYMHHPTDRIAFVTPVVEHWLEREIA